MKFTRKANTIFDRTIGVLALFAGILIILIMIVISTEVITRFTLGSSIVWIIEITEYSLLWITFLGTTWVLKGEGHVKMDMVLNRLNIRNKALLNIITSVVGAIACLVVTWFAVKITWYHFLIGYKFTRVLEPPSYPILAIIPVGSFLLFIQFLRRVYGYLGSRRASKNKE